MAAPIDRYIAAKWLKGKADEFCKEAELEAAGELSEINEAHGATEIASKLFDGTKFRYSRTRAKKVTEYRMADRPAFAEWLEGNPDACGAYVQNNAEAFGKWWFESTGELPDGMARTEYTQEGKMGAPKLYGYSAEDVERVIRENNLLEGVGPLLLGGADG